MSGPFILAFTVWMLLTANWSWANILLGLLASVLVSFLPQHRFSAIQFIRLAFNILIRLPLALWETLLLVLFPHKHERIHLEKMRKPQDPWAVFCQTFITTFTPHTLVVSEEDNDELKLHSIERKEKS